MIDTLVLVRGVHFAATLLTAGSVMFTVLVAEPSRRITQLVWAGFALTILSGAVWLALIAANILDVPLAGIWRDGGLWTVVTETRFGQVACLRLGLAVALGLLMTFPGPHMLKLAAAAGLAGLIAVVGHAGATPGAMGRLHLSSDVVHVLAAAAWLGGLPALALTLPGNAQAAVTATARFSVLGIICVAALLASGAINSWQLLNGPGDLLATAYGRVLLAKVALFAAMIAVAAVNRLWLMPRLPVTMRALRRNCLIETGLGLAVLLLVGALGTMIPGGHVHTDVAPPPSEAAFVHIHTEVVMADVTIDPGSAGKSTATIRLSREDSSEYPARDVKLAIKSRDTGTPLPERAAVQSPDGTWQIENIDIPSAGVWTLRLTIGAASGPAVSLDAPIVITQ